MTDPRETIRRALDEALGRARAASSTAALEEVRVGALGRKAAMSQIKATLGGLSDAERRDLGRLLNEARDRIEAALAERRAVLEADELRQTLERDRIDATLPGRGFPQGHPHPITLITERVVDVFVGMGYRVVEGPEIETDWYNFQALNIPPFHPARSSHDTMWLADLDLLLRTHTSPMQARAMEKEGPPIYIVVPGRVYRRDPFDASHSPVFHQIEGLAVDRGIRMSDLKGTLAAFARELFGPHQRVRLRPSYFPFTEPSAEVDILCLFCSGEGCSACKRTGWMEILGAGMVHPNVLKGVGYDPEEFTGFAFGMGVERIAMLALEVPDMRLFFENDQRFLAGFAP